MIDSRFFVTRSASRNARAALAAVAAFGMCWPLHMACAQTMGGATQQGAAAPATASASSVLSSTLVIDNFENGVGEWTRNDKTKSGLSDIVTSAPGLLPTSKGAALLTFKSGQGSWASLSRPINGASWARIGARELVFSVEGSGDLQGVDLQLRAKTADGDTVFSLAQSVRLDVKTWRTVAIPLSDFKGPKGESLGLQMANLYLLQFAQSGTWNSRFFTLDDLFVRGTGVPIVAPKPPVTTTAPAEIAPPGAPLPTGAVAVAVNVDFKRVIGQIRAAANVSVVAPYDAASTGALEMGANYRAPLATLKPKFVRLDVAALADLTDSSRPAFDFSRLVSAVRRVRSLPAEPLITISNPNEWGLDAKGYGALAGATARALNPKGASLARYFELASWNGATDASEALQFYNAGYGAVKGVSSHLAVGGYGAPTGDVKAQNALLGGARGLDFLAGSYYGANSGQPTDGVLLSNARSIPDLKTAAGLLDKSRFKRAPLYVTGANLSQTRNEGDYVPSDKRLVDPVAGAWWAEFLGSGSRLADQIFHNDATNPEWGLLLVQDKAQAFPAYYSMYLWNTYFAGGSQRVVADSANDAIFAVATNTKTAHNLMLVNTTALPQVAQVGIRGFPTLRQVRVHTTDDPSQGVRTAKLPNSPFQTLRLQPYSVSVVQFIEPPK